MDPLDPRVDILCYLRGYQVRAIKSSHNYEASDRCIARGETLRGSVGRGTRSREGRESEGGHQEREEEEKEKMVDAEMRNTRKIIISPLKSNLGNGKDRGSLMMLQHDVTEQRSRSEIIALCYDAGSGGCKMEVVRMMRAYFWILCQSVLFIYEWMV